MPKGLKNEISLALHDGAAKKIFFFIGKDPVFLAEIIPFLLPLFIKQNDYVYLKGEYADEIYFISKGKVHYVHDDAILSVCYKGDYFGEIEVVQENLRNYSTKAANDAELLTMNKPLILNIQKKFPDEWNSISAKAFDAEIINEKALVESCELKRLDEGLISFEEYNKNLEQRKENNRVFSKMKLTTSIMKKDKPKVTLETIFDDLQTLTNSVNLLKSEVESLKN